jgi:hypothetical protein
MASNRSGFTPASVAILLGSFVVALGVITYFGLTEHVRYVREQTEKERLLATIERLAAGVRPFVPPVPTESQAAATSSISTSTVKTASSTATSTSMTFPLYSTMKSVTPTSTSTSTPPGPKPAVASSTASTSTVKASPPPAKKPAVPAPAPAPAPITARRLLDATTYAPVQQLNGTYRLQFHTVLTGNVLDFRWYPPAGDVLSASGVPTFASTFSCDQSVDADQDNFVFRIRSPYVCSITLTGSGGDRWTKQVNFTTGPGLVAATVVTANPYLRDNINESYLQIANTDDRAVAVTGLSFDFSFRSLDTTQPAIIRFSLGDTQTVFGEFSLQDATPNAGAAETYGRRELTVPVSGMSIDANDRKAVRIQALGVRHKVALSLPDSFVNVTVNKVTLDRSDLRIIGVPATVQWSCTKTYDANNPDSRCQ